VEVGRIGVQPLLQVDRLQVRFGGIRALQEVSFEVRHGWICGLIGPNGAGKTTLFNCVSRLYVPQGGSIVFDGRDLLAVAAHHIAGLGVGRTFQNLAFFKSMTVLENVMVGAHCATHSGFFANGVRTRRAARDDAEAARRAQELLELVGLDAVAHEPVSALPFGLQKRMEIARALAGSPKLLLLDEPAAGLNHEEIEALEVLVRRIRDELHVTVLLVEHHMGLVMALCDRLVVLDFGSKIAEGTPEQVRSNPAVIRAYLGHRDSATAAR
jgi:branched-chain amino acid transport system ATP-binding protein